MKQLLYWVTQENSIEFLVQSNLPYILVPMVRAHYCAPYPKWPYVWYEANICCPCCMMSLYSRTVKIVDEGLYFIFSFHFSFYFSFLFLFNFLFLEQLGLGFISHAVTSVTNWWCSHKTDHETWEKEVEDSRTKRHHTAWTTHAGLM